MWAVVIVIADGLVVIAVVISTGQCTSVVQGRVVVSNSSVRSTADAVINYRGFIHRGEERLGHYVLGSVLVVAVGVRVFFGICSSADFN